MRLYLPKSLLFLRHKLFYSRLFLVGKYQSKTGQRFHTQKRAKSALTTKKTSFSSIINKYLDLKKIINLVKDAKITKFFRSIGSRLISVCFAPKKWTDWVANTAIATACLVLAVLFVPQLYFSIFPPQTIPVEATESGSALGGDFRLGSFSPQKWKELSAASNAGDSGVVGDATKTAGLVSDSGEVIRKPPYTPPVDETLPEGQWLVIPRIGVRSALQATANYEDALKTGLWLAPDYGKPGTFDLPMIVAGHRYGWNWWWKNDYWKYHSFFLLPKLKPGDRVEVIADKRKWIYEIYAGEEGDEITDYQADLILYTCKFISSDVRHFRYARLIDPNADSQKISAVNSGSAN